MIANFCFCCDKELAVVPGGSLSEDDPQCAEAVMFHAQGNYGSTLFDPPVYRGGRVQLVINICDDCLLKKRERVLLATTDKPLPIVSYTPWDPQEDFR